MDAPNYRPRLASFRALAFNAKNNVPNVVNAETGFELSPTIEVAFAVSTSPEGLIEAFVNIRLQGRAALMTVPDETIAEFSATYEARYMPLGL